MIPFILYTIGCGDGAAPEKQEKSRRKKTVVTEVAVVTKVDPKVQALINKDLEERIAVHKEKLGIEHFGLPRVEPGFPKAGCYVGSALYHPATDAIYLMSFGDLPNNGLFSPNNDGDSTSVHIIDHELGHFYADQLHESLGKGDWPLYPNEMTLNTPGINMISEGIAEWFDRTINCREDAFTDTDYPEGFVNWYVHSTAVYDGGISNVIYNGGYHLVKPILDKHGAAGIEYLITHPPVSDDFSDLPGYRTKVLEVLEAK